MAHRGSSRPRKRGCSGHGWGFVAPDVNDPPRCIIMCRERFLRELLPKDETFERVCQALEDMGHHTTDSREQPFRALYCCDAQLCGVDNLGESGKDPNVNWFINACQDIGYHSIADPGPPDAGYVCDSESINGGGARCQKAQSAESSIQDEASSESSASRTSSGAHHRSENATSRTSEEASMSAQLQSPMPDTTYSTSSDPSLAASLDPANREDDVREDEGLPVGVKVTIILVAILGLVAIAALVICLLRRRRSRRGRSDIRRHIKHPTSPPPAESPTPLVSPTVSHTDADGVPLTPPARLRERRFLPAPAEQSPTTTTPGHHGSQRRDRPGFPTSPLCSPISGNLAPRHERKPRIYSASHVPTLPTIVMTAPDGGRMSQNDHRSVSFSGGVEATPPPPASAQRSSPLGNNGSPPRPPRSRDGPVVNISNLVSPGPPPTRALPSTPPTRPSTPTKPVSSAAHPSAPGRGVFVPKTAQGIVLSPEARELRDMTEDYARDPVRNSGASWTGIAPGVGASFMKGRSANSPVMDERDLERLGGSY